MRISLLSHSWTLFAVREIIVRLRSFSTKTIAAPRVVPRKGIMIPRKTAKDMVAFRGFFKALLDLQEDRAILWHCTDGKDRTGCAAMLVLFALGADRETVMHDYMPTKVYNTEILETIRRRVAPLGMSDEKLNALLFMSGGVAETYMDNAIEALNRECGSVQGYLRNSALVRRRSEKYGVSY